MKHKFHPSTIHHFKAIIACHTRIPRKKKKHFKKNVMIPFDKTIREYEKECMLDKYIAYYPFLGFDKRLSSEESKINFISR